MTAAVAEETAESKLLVALHMRGLDEYGTTIRTKDMRVWAGLEAPGDDLVWLDCIQEAGAVLLHDRLMWLRANHNGSYTFVLPEEHADTAAVDHRRALSKAGGKADDRLRHVNRDRLTGEQQRHADRVQARTAELRTMIRRGVKRLFG